MSTHTFLLLCMVMPSLAATAARASEIIYRVRNETLHRIDPRLFGQFMERPSWGEIGPEGALVPGTQDLQPGVLKLIRRMEIPILRFPGGTDVDFLDWRDMISNVPGRGAERPVSTGHKGDKVTNGFGYDEFLRLCEELNSQAILVVNFRDALLKNRPLQEQASHVAGLVAYCNAPVGAKLPEGMPDWPSVRAKNGRPAPYGVKYWQIGNETWAFTKELKQLVPQDPEKFYVECVVAFGQAMLAVDPTIEFIVDGDFGQLVRDRLGQKVRYLVFHTYTPWGMKEVTKDGKDVPLETLTVADVWRAWVATPAIDADGLAMIRNSLLDKARQGGFKVAVTEWNWNGGWWALGHGQRAPPSSALAKGLGAAGFLHGLMRSADVIEVGCQSMLVGNRWDIHAIRADREGKSPPYYMPSGQVTMLYSQHHGERLLAMESAGVPTYCQPFKMGGIAPKQKVACLDALATASGQAVFFHVINRHFDQPMEVMVDLTALAPLATRGRHYMLQGRLNDRPLEGEPVQVAEINSSEIPFDGKILKVALPPRTVSCIEIHRKR